MRVKKCMVSIVALLLISGVLRGSGEFPSGARYLIIAPDSFYDALLPLAQWKTQKGMLAKIAKLSETGHSASEIKSYIQNAYNTWDPRPEYVFLVGNGDSIPFVTVSGVRSDCYYGNMDDDIYDEIIPGRFPAFNVSEVENYVNKVLNYEKNPYTGDMNWFLKATQMVEVDYDDDDSIYWGDVMHAESLMYKAGFIHVDMFSDSAGYSASDVYAAIEDGRSFINFRGQSVCHWWSPFDVDPYSTNPGLKLPVVVSPTCGQVSSSFSCGSEWVRAGTVAEPRGGVAFCGPTTVITGGAYKRSALDRGFFDYVFTDSGDSIVAFGKGVEAGRKRYYDLYADYTEFYGFQCIADPELNIWTGKPKQLVVSYPGTIPSGPYNLNVHVEDVSGDTVKYALVCAMKESSIYAYGYTDQYGDVTLSIETQPTDTVLITVTARNKIPHQGFTVASTSGPFVAYKKHEIVDDVYGNGDGYANPGETTELRIWAENIGTQGAYGVYGKLTSPDSAVAILQDSSFYGDLLPGDSSAGTSLYKIQLDSACYPGQTIPMTLTFHDSNSHTWVQHFDLVIYAPLFEFEDRIVYDTNGGDGDGIPEPGETIDLYVAVRNSGNLDAQSAYGILSTSDPYATVVRDSSSYGAIQSGETEVNAVSYRVSISSSCPNSHDIVFSLSMASAGGFTGDLQFDVLIGALQDDMENGQGNWEHYVITSDYNDEWHLESYRNHTPGGTYSWKCGGTGSAPYSNYEDAALVTPEFYLPESSQLVFWHWMEAETSGWYTGECYDGGAVYISIDGGPFEQITPVGGYPFTIRGGSGNPLPDGTPVFSGSFDWTQAFFDLTGYSGTARIMFRFTSDQGITYEGWYIDDVEIQTNISTEPHIVVNPTEIDTSAYEDEVVVDTIVVQNTGTATLDFTVEIETLRIEAIRRSMNKSSRQSWIEVTPTSGSVPPSGQTYLQVTLNANLLSGGVHNATIHINSNDPSNSVVDVPVTFNVLEYQPHIVVTPTQIDTSAQEGEVVYDTIIIENTGEGSLTFNVETEFVRILGRVASRKAIAGDYRQDWIEISPISGTVAPGGMAYLQVRLDATALSTGNYEADIYIYNNDTSNSVVDVPVNFEVLPLYPDIFVEPAEIDTSAYEGFVVFDTLLIGNAGEADLTFNVETELRSDIRASYAAEEHIKSGDSRQDWIEVLPDSGSVVPGGTLYVQVKLDATQLSTGLHQADILIYSNDPDEPTVDIAVNFNVLETAGIFIRGDANADGSVDIVDASYFLANILPQPDFSCADAADINDDGVLTIVDASYLLEHLLPQPSLPEPNMHCGIDPTEDTLSCDNYPPCSGIKLNVSEPSVFDTLYVGTVFAIRNAKPLSSFEIDIYGKIESYSFTDSGYLIDEFDFFKTAHDKEKLILAGLKSLSPKGAGFSLDPGLNKLFGFSYIGFIDSVRAFYGTGEGEKVYPVVILGNTGVTDIDIDGLTFRILQSNPNPFRKFVDVSFSLPYRMAYRIEIYDVAGRLIKSERFGMQEPGIKNYRWHGEDNLGRKVRNGVYFIKLKAGEFEAICRVILTE